LPSLLKSFTTHPACRLLTNSAATDQRATFYDYPLLKSNLSADNNLDNTLINMLFLNNIKGGRF
jgi:hypothetical protein